MKKGEIMVADYPIGKSVVLNAIYDMTERMDIRLIESDSRKGHIRFREKSGQYDGSIDITSQKMQRVCIQESSWREFPPKR